jgi:hypothetical protein
MGLSDDAMLVCRKYKYGKEKSSLPHTVSVPSSGGAGHRRKIFISTTLRPLGIMVGSIEHVLGHH